MISYSTSVRPIVAAVFMVPVVGLVIVGPVVGETHTYIYIYIYMQTVLFRPSGPHQCSADARMEVRLYSHPK